MFYTRDALLANKNLQAQWGELWANRDIFSKQQEVMVNQYRPFMTSEMLQANALAGPSRNFWEEVDRQIIQMRNLEPGMEILNDLMAVQTVLPIGKTVKLYNIVGDIADDVSVSMDGQPPYSFDHTDYDSDGDPIPIFTAGYGVNWRHAAGLQTVGIELVLDSQAAKMRKFYKGLVSYMMDGDSRIRVQGYQAQGMRNHRNTIKINLGSSIGGQNIDLTSATQQELIDFFTKGAFGTSARENKVDVYDVVWVSPEIMANLDSDYINGTVVNGTVRERILARAKIREFRETYALSENEFLGYQRRKDVISPLVGMATGVVPLPRPMPQSNYNFQIMSASGLQITRDGEDLSGVIYGANLD